MSVTIENLPIIFLILVGIGMVVVLIGIMRLANEQDHSSVYTDLDENSHTEHLEDLFSYFLQEEEKKNQSFREMVMDVTKSKEQPIPVKSIKKKEPTKTVTKEKANMQVEQAVYKEIINRYEMGQDIETIAKDLKKGTGEVKLIISLYARR